MMQKGAYKGANKSKRILGSKLKLHLISIILVYIVNFHENRSIFVQNFGDMVLPARKVLVHMISKLIQRFTSNQRHLLVIFI